MTFKVIETFSGIGAQAKALERLQKKNESFDFDIVATCEWEIGAMYAYDLIHNGPQNLDGYSDYTKEDLLSRLIDLNLSNDGKTPMTKQSLSRMSINQLKSILCSIERNNNLIDITSVHANNLPDADLLTYSFPCQDLSISSFWWNNTSGIDPDSGNRSSLLWQVGRILNEYKSFDKPLPKFLLMENVTQIESPMHEENFTRWKNLLRELGYTVNKTFKLNASNFGIPQKRERTYMISVLAGKHSEQVKEELDNSFLLKEKNLPSDFGRFFKLDYTNKEYLDEAIESIPNYTRSRKEIHRDAAILAKGNKPTNTIAKTITTKQDRNPTSGVIEHHLKLDNSKLAPYRNLTPRETFLLMGFDEHDFQILKDNNIYVSNTRKFLSHSKFLKLTGNSIVVNVLESVFEQILSIDDKYFKQDSTSYTLTLNNNNKQNKKVM